VVAPVGTSARDLEVVLRATIEHPQETEPASGSAVPRAQKRGVVVDLARHRVLIDGRDVGLTFKEFELLQVLVTNVGKTLDRESLRDAIATGAEPDVNDRTIDVHIRRLRVKFGEFPDIIRTVQGRGYRFDVRGDVTVLRTSTPSPDLF